MDTVEISKLHQLMYQYDEYKQSLYLSYPIESYWNRNVQEKQLRERLLQIKQADLYLHFPFCNEICYYCCCKTIRCLNEQQKEDYLNLLEKELEYKFDGKKDIVIENMHWGGGTPTLMAVNQMQRLLKLLRKHFTLSDEGVRNIEVFPDKNFVTKEKLMFLYENGFTHISIGVQDLNPRVLNAIHRKAELKDIQDIIHMARSIGFQISMDICYGLPYQGLSEFEYTIKEIFALQPERIVMYPYSHFPYINALQRKIPELSIPNNFIKTLIKKIANDQLAEEYVLFGYDTYLRKDTEEEKDWESSELVHGFMGTEKNTGNPLLGVGVSAISKVGNTYIKNQTSLKQYQDMLMSHIWPVEKMYDMTKDDQIRYDIIEKHILIDHCIVPKQIEQQYGIIFDRTFASELVKLKKMQELGLVSGVNTPKIKISEYGHYFIKCIARVFDLYN